MLPLLSAALAPGDSWDSPVFCSLWVAPGQSYGLVKSALIPRLNGHIYLAAAAQVPLSITTFAPLAVAAALVSSWT